MTKEQLQEIREPIPDASGYFVTRNGRVLSSGSNWRGYGERELAQHSNNRGYLAVQIKMNNGQSRKLCVHKLVALLFVGDKPSPAHQVRHLDGNKTNNGADNLAWGTALENASDRELHGRTARGEANGASRLTSKTVIAARQLAAKGWSQRRIARTFGVSQPTIGNLLRGELWSHVKAKP